MQRRLEKLSAYVHRHYAAPQELIDVFNLNLFPDKDERARLLAMVDELAPKVTWKPHGPRLGTLTTEEQDLLESWICLQLAITAGDHGLAERTRRYLLLSEQEKEWIADMFLATDERCLSDVSCHDAPTIQWEGSLARIHRSALQFAKDHTRQDRAHGYALRRWDIDEMWMWLQVCQVEGQYA